VDLGGSPIPDVGCMMAVEHPRCGDPRIYNLIHCQSAEVSKIRLVLRFGRGLLGTTHIYTPEGTMLQRPEVPQGFGMCGNPHHELQAHCAFVNTSKRDRTCPLRDVGAQMKPRQNE